MRVRVLVHAKLHRRHAGLEHALHRDGEPVHGQAAQGALHLLERHTGVDQRAENHVAGGAGKTVEVQRLHQSVPFSEAEIPARAKDDVIHQRNAHQLAHLLHPPRHRDVGVLGVGSPDG